MKYFTPENLLSSNEISASDIESICKFYCLDGNVIASERNAFVAVYKQMSKFIDMSDMSSSHRAHETPQDADTVAADDCPRSDSDDDDTADEPIDTVAPRRRNWENHSFVKPLRCLEELSSFTNLSFLYKILATVAVTSCSAERVMSRVKIIKKPIAQHDER